MYIVMIWSLQNRKEEEAADWGTPRGASLAAVSPGADIWGQGPLLIGVGPNACELNEKITRSGEESAAVVGVLFTALLQSHPRGGEDASMRGGQWRCKDIPLRTFNAQKSVV